MNVTAILRKFQYSPYKTRLVVDKIRGLKVEEATKILMFTNKKASLPLLNLIKSAVANAVNNYKSSKENLFLKEILVDSDGMLKRSMPRARGMSFPIRKRYSRIKVVLSNGEDPKIEKVKENTKEVNNKIEK